MAVDDFFGEGHWFVESAFDDVYIFLELSISILDEFGWLVFREWGVENGCSGCESSRV
jgi:hypothetical protein